MLLVEESPFHLTVLIEASIALEHHAQPSDLKSLFGNEWQERRERLMLIAETPPRANKLPHLLSGNPLPGNRNL
jgi:hypothetical protein